MVQQYHISFTRNGYGGTEYSYGEMECTSISELRRKLIKKGFPKGGNCFYIYKPGYKLFATLTNQQPLYPGIWVWSGGQTQDGGWRVIDPKTGKIISRRD